MKRYQCTCWRGAAQCRTFSVAVTTVATHSNIYYKIAEDMSIGFNPLYNGQTLRDIAIRQLMGPTIGTSESGDWPRPGNQGNDTLWLDHSIATWMTTPTHGT
eukprot:3547186-Amphidinium_carterae.1